MLQETASLIPSWHQLIPNFLQRSHSGCWPGLHCPSDWCVCRDTALPGVWYRETLNPLPGPFFGLFSPTSFSAILSFQLSLFLDDASIHRAPSLPSTGESGSSVPGCPHTIAALTPSLPGHKGHQRLPGEVVESPSLEGFEGSVCTQCRGLVNTAVFGHGWDSMISEVFFNLIDSVLAILSFTRCYFYPGITGEALSRL